jgi:hypothetical protein
VSASEIIKELPKLSEAERRAVFQKLRELAGQNEDSIELYSPERIAEFERGEKELEEFFAGKDCVKPAECGSFSMPTSSSLPQTPPAQFDDF